MAIDIAQDCFEWCIERVCGPNTYEGKLEFDEYIRQLFFWEFP